MCRVRTWLGWPHVFVECLGLGPAPSGLEEGAQVLDGQRGFAVELQRCQQVMLPALSFLSLQLDKSEVASGPRAMLEQASSSSVTGEEAHITGPASSMHKVPPAFLTLEHYTSPPFPPQHLGWEPDMAGPVMVPLYVFIP